MARYSCRVNTGLLFTAGTLVFEVLFPFEVGTLIKATEDKNNG
jgi:hypothetical protein